jgi:AmmeMemoRadiSam system protein B
MIVSLTRGSIVGLAIGCLLALSQAGCDEKGSKADSSKKEERPSASRTAKGGGGKSLKARLRELDYSTIPFIRKLDGPGLMAHKRKTGMTVCGAAPVALLLSALSQSGKPIGVKVLDYRTSGDVTGDWENTVSYFSIALYEKPSKKGAPEKSDEASEPSGNKESAGEARPERVRAMATGRGWYPKSKGKLERRLRGYLKKADPDEIPGRLVAIISPHAGYAFSGVTAAHGFKLLKKKGRAAGFERVVVLGSPHRVRLRGISVAPYTHYDTPLGQMPMDLDAADALAKRPLYESVARAHAREHSVEMQLPFLRYLAPRLRLLALLVGWVPPAKLATAARPLVELMDGKTLFVASSDFTHRGPRFGYEPLSGLGE